MMSEEEPKKQIAFTPRKLADAHAQAHLRKLEAIIGLDGFSSLRTEEVEALLEYYQLGVKNGSFPDEGTANKLVEELNGRLMGLLKPPGETGQDQFQVTIKRYDSYKWRDDEIEEIRRSRKGGGPIFPSRLPALVKLDENANFDLVDFQPQAGGLLYGIEEMQPITLSNNLVIQPGSKPLVTISANGKVTIHDEANIDEAAQAFWGFVMAHDPFPGIRDALAKAERALQGWDGVEDSPEEREALRAVRDQLSRLKSP